MSFLAKQDFFLLSLFYGKGVDSANDILANPNRTKLNVRDIYTFFRPTPVHCRKKKKKTPTDCVQTVPLVLCLFPHTLIKYYMTRCCKKAVHIQHSECVLFVFWRGQSVSLCVCVCVLFAILYMVSSALDISCVARRWGSLICPVLCVIVFKEHACLQRLGANPFCLAESRYVFTDPPIHICLIGLFVFMQNFTRLCSVGVSVLLASGYIPELVAVMLSGSLRYGAKWCYLITTTSGKPSHFNSQNTRSL